MLVQSVLYQVACDLVPSGSRFWNVEGVQKNTTYFFAFLQLTRAWRAVDEGVVKEAERLDTVGQ